MFSYNRRPISLKSSCRNMHHKHNKIETIRFHFFFVPERQGTKQKAGQNAPATSSNRSKNPVALKRCLICTSSLQHFFSVLLQCIFDRVRSFLLLFYLLLGLMSSFVSLQQVFLPAEAPSPAPNAQGSPKKETLFFFNITLPWI